MEGAFVVVKIMTSARSRYLVNLTDHEGFRFDLFQLILPNHLANRTVTTTQHMVGDCESEPITLTNQRDHGDHAPLYQLQLRCYGQLRSWVDP